MGLTDDVKDLQGKIKELEPKPKEKKFFLRKRLAGNQLKKDWVTVMKINVNGQVDFKKLKIDEQTVFEDGVPRLCQADHILYYKKNPMIILPSWSVKPFSPADAHKESEKDGSNTKGYKILMAKMLKETVNPKKPIAGWIKWVAGLALLGLIVYALVTGGGR